MAEPVLSVSTPAHGDSDVYINQNITATFTAALDATTVTDNTFVLIDRSNNDRYPVSVTYNSTLFRVTVVLSGLLRENTSYRLLVVGLDLSVTGPLSAGDGTDLVTSIAVEFTTGDNIYDIDSVLEKEAQSKTLEGDLFLPSNVKALGEDFTILRVRPENHSNNVPVDLTGDKTIRFTFNKALYTGAGGDLQYWATAEAYPLVHDAYLAVSGVVGSATAPVGFISVDNTDLVITFTGEVPNNLGISVELHTSIQSEDLENYGGELIYNVSTQLYPDVMPIRTIKREIRPLPVEDIYNDYVAALMHKNTFFLWEKTGRGLDLGAIAWPATKYIMYSTMLDIMEDADYAKFLTAGTRKQLGDLNVSVDSLIGRLAMKIASAQKAKEISLNSLYPGWQFQTAVRSLGLGEESPRLWYAPSNKYTNPMYKYYQPDLPVSNVALSRAAKTTNPYLL